MPNVKEGFHYTPEIIAKELLKDIDFENGYSVLETCKGGGSFWKHLPPNIIKDFCEIDMGRDFFEYNNKVDISIANPPYKTEIDGKLQNIIIKWMDHQFSITNKECWYLLNNKY